MYQANIIQFLPRENLQGRTVMEHVTSKTPDISKYNDFDFYDLVLYHPGLYPNFNDKNRTLVQWLGVSHRIGSDMCYWTVAKSGTVIVETVVKHATIYDMLNTKTAAQVEILNIDINE